MTSSSNTTIVLKSLSILLGLFFIFLGLVKVTPAVSKDLYKDMRKEFVKYSKVFPLSETLGFKIPSKWYRRTIGGMEIGCGAVLALIPSAPLKRGVNGILLLMSLLSVYSHFLTDEKFERTATALVLLFMTTCRIIVDFQTDRKLITSLFMNSTSSASTSSASSPGGSGGGQGGEGQTSQEHLEDEKVKSE